MATLTKLIVKNLKPKSDQPLTCSYQDPRTKQYMHLIENGYDVREGKLKEGDKIHRFVVGAGGEKEFEFNLETQTQAFERVSNWWKFHPNVQIPGGKNPNLVMPNWEVYVEADQVQMQFVAMEEKVRVINLLRGMRFPELRNTAYGIGNDPAGLSHRALLVRLIGPTFEGDALLKKTTINGVQMYAVIALRDKKSVEVEHIVYAHKAAHFNIITRENDVFVFGDKTLGGTMERVVEFFKVNPDFYNNYIVPEVDKKDIIDMDLSDMDEKVKVTEAKMESQQKKTEKEQAKQQLPEDETPETASNSDRLLEKAVQSYNEEKPPSVGRSNLLQAPAKKAEIDPKFQQPAKKVG